jgi:hypothetical protein
MPYVTGPIEQHGAIVGLKVGVIEARRKILSKHGLAIPRPVPIQAQIDTGASCTAIDHSVSRQLDVGPTGKTKVLVPSVASDPRELDEYAGSIFLPGPDDPERYLPWVEGVMSCDMPGQEGYQA